MGIADGRTTLKKIAFQVGNKFFRFALNPETMVYSRPHRTTTLKTKSRIVVEDFQSDVPTVTISGTTGFNPTGRTADRGIEKIREMKAFIIDYAAAGGNGSKSADDFFFHDFTNKESYVVHLSPEGITYTQDASSPLTHRYEIKLVILREASEPSDEEVVSPEIGNRLPSLPDGTEPQTVNPYGSNSGAIQQYNAGSGSTNIYPQGTSTAPSTEAVNPQAPSSVSYNYGIDGLRYSVGYYSRARGLNS